jgi:hypothetical protein
LPPVGSGRKPFVHQFGPTLQSADRVLGRHLTEGNENMIAQLYQRYVQYRRVGFSPFASLHYAWMVVTSRTRPLSFH